MEKIVKNTARNASLLYILTIAKLIFPLATLPYLTRVLSQEAYGVVSYVKSCMNYLQIIIDFGFLVSAAKDIVRANGDKEKIGVETGQVLVLKILLALVGLCVSLVMALTIPILKPFFLFTMLSAVAIAITALFTDYLFHGLEKMHYVSFVYLISKGIVIALTFILVKNDADIILIPIMDIIGNAVAVGFTWIVVHRLGIKVKIRGLKECFRKLKESSIYFATNMVSTVFSALITLLIGIFIEDLVQVGYWSVCMQLIVAVQHLYNPINDGIYPQMLKQKNLKFIWRVLVVFMPVVLVGCVFCFFCSEWILIIISGVKYAGASPLFRRLLPILFFSFPSMLFGWPTLGAIDKVNLVTWSAVGAAIFQILGIVILMLFGAFTLYNIALLRGATECVLMLLRLIMVLKNKKNFVIPPQTEEKLQ